MIKHVVSAIAAAMLVLSTQAYAVQNTETGILVIGSGATAANEIPIILMKPNQKLTELPSGKPDDMIAYTDVVTTGASGEYRIQIPLPSDCAAGLYRIFAGNTEDSFYFAGAQDKQAAIQVFLSGNAQEIYNCLAEENRYYGLLSAETESYQKLYRILPEEAKNKACQELAQFTYSGGHTTVAEMDVLLKNFDAALNTACTGQFEEYGFAAIKPLLTQENLMPVLSDYQALLGIDIKRITDDDNQQAVSAAIYNALKDQQSMTAMELCSACYEQAALIKINGLTPYTCGRILEIVAEYPEVFGNALIESGFQALSENLQNQVLTKLVSGANYSSKTEFVTALKTAVSKAGTATPTQTPNRGGGSSGSTGSGGSGYVPMPAPQNTPMPTDPTPTPDSGFRDLNGYEWAGEAIRALSEKNIVSGVNENEFQPGRSVTREEFVKLVLNACGIPIEPEKTSAFEDVPENAWYADAVATAYSLGIVKGISETYFGVGQRITRQDMAVILSKAADYRKTELPVNREPVTFSDESEIADYAGEAVKQLCCAGIINGYDNNQFMPGAYASRAEAAKLLYEYVKAEENAHD